MRARDAKANRSLQEKDFRPPPQSPFHRRLQARRDDLRSRVVVRALAFGQENRTLSEYIDWAVEQARRMNEIDMQVEGDTDDEKAKSLVRAMLEAGLAERL